ncbi:MAG TPA: DUF4129 domain-containing protein, partial [Arthrobacter sp.]|nr:DUF4129 domain-containing protein [Arthrobacter sp.]
ASPRLVRAGVRARRLRGTGSGRNRVTEPPLVWSELQDLATDYGVRPQPSETPRTFSARLRGSLTPEPPDAGTAQAVTVLTDAYERHRYGRPSGQDSVHPGLPEEAAVAHINKVRRALRRKAGIVGRLHADWLPPSVISRWGAVAGWPFRVLGRAALRTGRAASALSRRTRSGIRRLRQG